MTLAGYDTDRIEAFAFAKAFLIQAPLHNFTICQPVHDIILRKQISWKAGSRSICSSGKAGIFRYFHLRWPGFPQTQLQIYRQGWALAAGILKEL